MISRRLHAGIGTAGLSSKADQPSLRSLEAILIRDVVLPEAIQRAIDQKLAAEQEVLKMKYVVEVTRAAADQKRIEAQGIYDYNHIVSTSLSPAVLEFERIEQLNKLAASSPTASNVAMACPSTGRPRPAGRSSPLPRCSSW